MYKQITAKKKILIFFLIVGSNYYQNIQAIDTQNSNSKSNIFSIQGLFTAIGCCYTIYCLYQYILIINQQAKLESALSEIITNNLTQNTRLPVEKPFIVIEGEKNAVKKQINLFCEKTNNSIKVSFIDSEKENIEEIFLENLNSLNEIKLKRRLLFLPIYTEKTEKIKINCYNLPDIFNLVEKVLNEKIKPFEKSLQPLKELLETFAKQKNYKIPLPNRIFNLQKISLDRISNIQNYIMLEIKKHNLPLSSVITDPIYFEQTVQYISNKESSNNLQILLLINNKENKEMPNILNSNHIFDSIPLEENYT